MKSTSSVRDNYADELYTRHGTTRWCSTCGRNTTHRQYRGDQYHENLEKIPGMRYDQ